MARALEPAAAGEKRIARIGIWSYETDGASYSAGNGKDTLTVSLQWSFGQGSAGKTWLYRRGGAWYESMVSYFSALNGLDTTMGDQSIAPRNPGEAAGRLLPASEAMKCFDCHATGVVKTPELDLSKMAPGVQCERCHGPAEGHLNGSRMRSLRPLSTEETSDFCGECHRTWSQVSINGPRGVQNVRFQPYRLALSRCYDTVDKRIACTACHDPHRDLDTRPASYDAKCLACHATAAREHCPVSKQNCITCHMPETELPGAHRKFTDHRIRIVKAGESYPD